MKHQIPAVDIAIVRRKNLNPSHPDYNKWESQLMTGHWIPTTYRAIQQALALGWHVLWNPETRKQPIYRS